MHAAAQTTRKHRNLCLMIQDGSQKRSLMILALSDPIRVSKRNWFGHGLVNDVTACSYQDWLRSSGGWMKWGFATCSMLHPPHHKLDCRLLIVVSHATSSTRLWPRQEDLWVRPQIRNHVVWFFKLHLVQGGCQIALKLIPDDPKLIPDWSKIAQTNAKHTFIKSTNVEVQRILGWPQSAPRLHWQFASADQECQNE